MSKTVEAVKSAFSKTCVNGYKAANIGQDGKLVPFSYLRNDLSQWAKEAFDRNEQWFYCDPVDPKKPSGRLKLSKPRYVYKLTRPLTQKEYDCLLTALGYTKQL